MTELQADSEGTDLPGAAADQTAAVSPGSHGDKDHRKISSVRTVFSPDTDGCVL